MFRFSLIYAEVKGLLVPRSNFPHIFKFSGNLRTYKDITAEKKEELQTSFRPVYHHSFVEAQRYEFWESKNYFKPNKSEIDSFVMILPPPNVTGTLHLGHALTCTVQDVILRWKRMKGESVLWIPGIDHAGIATQAAVENYLHRSLGLSKHDLEKEEFLKILWEWKNEKAAKIIEQLKKIGASLDWSKLIFTMDSSHSKLVTNSFIQLYNNGVIYRKKGLINWSCALQSSISDIEIDWVTIDKKTEFNIPGYDKPVNFGYMFDIAYKVYSEGDEIVVSTTRPETILGDVAIAIHPDNPALSKLKNKYVWHPFRNEKIPIIVDDFVDQEFGTGAVKITPSHSMTDFEIGLKHNLKHIQVINEAGLINKIGTNEKFHGLKRFDARWAVISELKKLNLFRGLKPHSMKLPVCSRSGDIIEFLTKEQWFLKCDSLVKKAVSAVESGDLKIEPKSYENVWYNWLNTKPVRDWNLSRQLWWGHQIPMYECSYKDKMIWLPGSSLEEAKSKASETFKTSADDIKVVQDPDVLDTWFSSGLLSLNSVINQKRRPAISLMVTGHDILFFWVARMVMLSLHLTGELPFKEVLLHSLVFDANGKKMSKSLGNVIHPEDIINGLSASDMEDRLRNGLREGQISKNNFTTALTFQKTKLAKGIPDCGADALRFTLCSSCIQNFCMNFDFEVCLSNKFFCNKIYQAMNYCFKITDAYKKKREEFDLKDPKSEKEKLNCFDRWILSRLFRTVEGVNKNFVSYRFDLVTNAIKIFLIQDFCNFYLTSTKPVLENGTPFQFRTTVSVFFHCLETSLRLLCPFMPFVTEYLYQVMPSLNGLKKCESITVAKFPSIDDWSEFCNEDLERRFEKLSAFLTALRRAKIDFNLKGEKPNVFIKCPDELAELLFGEMKYAFNTLGGVRDLIRVVSLKRTNVIQQDIDENFTIFIEHKHKKSALLKFLEPTISKESGLNQSLDKLQKIKNSPEWEKMTHSQKYVYTKQIDNLDSELKKIKDFKFTIDNCDS